MAGIIPKRIALRNGYIAMQNSRAGDLLRVDGLVKAYGAVRALRGLSFDLRAGEVHALVGENGAGKSTLIKIITGAIAPDAGVITVGGRTESAMDPHAAHLAGIIMIASP